MAKRKNESSPVQNFKVTYQAYCKKDGWKGKVKTTSKEAYYEIDEHRTLFPNQTHETEVIVTQKISYFLKPDN